MSQERSATRSRFQTIMGLLGWLVLTFCAAWFGAQFTSGDWYASLRKPSFSPPGWLFGPVWTILYAMMAVAAWLVWKGMPRAGAGAALAWYMVQLVLNALWSWLFFGLQRPDLGMIDIIALWLAIVATIVIFRRQSSLAAALLYPYLAWVTFASVLNFTIWRLNL